MSKVGLVVDIGNGGYREGAFTPLKPFADPPPAAKALCERAAETSFAPREAKVFSAADSRHAQHPPSSVVAAADAADFSFATRSAARNRSDDSPALVAGASELTAAQRNVIVDIDDGGYREGPFTPQKPFSVPPPAEKSLHGHAAENVPRAAGSKSFRRCR